MPAKKEPAKKSAPKKAPAKKASARALDKFMEQVDKTYGKGKFQLGAKPKPYEVISSGSITLDRALVVGGYVRGRLVEIWGPEGAGKTTLAIFHCIEAQRAVKDRHVLWVDVEHRFDKKWAQDHGLDLSRLVFVQTDNAEEVADMVKDGCRSGLFSAIVVDSIGAMIPEKEKEKDADEAVVGTQAKLVTRMVKIAAVEADLSQTDVILLNQVRANIGYGADTTTGGGYALKHSTTMKLEVRRTSGGQLKIGSGDKAQQVGHLVTVKVERNSVALAYRKAEFALLYVPTEQYGPMGIDKAKEASDVGIGMGIIERSGAWYTNTLTGERVQGEASVTDMLRSQPDMIAAIRTKAIEMLSDDVVDDGGVPGDTEEPLTFDPMPEPETPDPEPDPDNPDGVTLPNHLQGDS